jgi:uncharacterized protein (DUF2235 family)
MKIPPGAEFMGKNLVVCCDGTDNEFGEDNTNVVRLFSVALKDPQKQLTFYDPGLGTFPATGAWTPIARWVTKQLGSGFGYGLSQNIADAYGFLVDNYTAGDRIYLFGFSRGAYTVRAVAALIHVCGLVQSQNRNLITYAIDLFKGEASRAKKKADLEEKRTGRKQPLVLPVCAEFKRVFSVSPGIHFLGVWDTVSSVGSIYDPFSLPYTRWNPSVRTVRHAVSIDEQRKFFRTNLWSTSSAETDVKQVWFAGVHADVGGGYPEAQSGLAKITFAWMLEEAITAQLQVDATKLPYVLPVGNVSPGPAPADALGVKHDELDRLWWKILQCVPRRRWSLDQTTDTYAWKWNFSIKPAPRRIEAGSLIHRTVFERIERHESYQPANLPAVVHNDEGVLVEWQKAVGGEKRGKVAETSTGN